MLAHIAHCLHRLEAVYRRFRHWLLNDDAVLRDIGEARVLLLPRVDFHLLTGSLGRLLPTGKVLLELVVTAATFKPFE